MAAISSTAMQRLTARQREVLALHYFADLAVADIAAELLRMGSRGT